MNKWEERLEDIEEGRKEGILEVARKMKHEGVKIPEILKFTGLTEAEIQKL